MQNLKIFQSLFYYEKMLKIIGVNYKDKEFIESRRKMLHWRLKVGIFLGAAIWLSCILLDLYIMNSPFYPWYFFVRITGAMVLIIFAFLSYTKLANKHTDLIAFLGGLSAFFFQGLLTWATPQAASLYTLGSVCISLGVAAILPLTFFKATSLHFIGYLTVISMGILIGKVNLTTAYIFYLVVISLCFTLVVIYCYFFDLQSYREFKLNKSLEEANRARLRAALRFLPAHLAKLIIESKNPKEELQHILDPKESFVCVVQADLRKFTSFLESHEDPKFVMHFLKDIYKELVPAIKDISTLKLIGDCIYAFCEERYTQGKASIYGLLTACIISLIAQSKKGKFPNFRPVFGIAVDYGRVLVANLDGEEFVDYSICGRVANRVARFEEITKLEIFKDLFGENYILISRYAHERIVNYTKLKEIKKINFSEFKVKVRDFPMEKEAFVLPSNAVYEISNKILGTIKDENVKHKLQKFIIKIT